MKQLTFMFLICAISAFIHAQDGALDLSFGNSGMAGNVIGPYGNQATVIAVQKDGKIVVAGAVRDQIDFATISITRYLPNGSLDSGFGTQGVKIVDNNGLRHTPTEIAVAKDGKIVLLADSYNNDTTVYIVVRLNTDGSLDNSFDTDGKITLYKPGFSCHIHDLALQQDGKVIVTGHLTSGGVSSIVVARFNADNGVPDTTFASDGFKIIDFDNSSEVGLNVNVRSDGKILVGCGMRDSSTSFNCILLLNNDGTFANALDNDGILIVPAENIILDLLILPDNKFIVLGDSDGKMVLEKYNENGTPDLSFGTNGSVADFSPEHTPQMADLALQADGKIVISGKDHFFWSYRVIVARYTSNGVLDATFGEGGLAYISTGHYIDVMGLAIQNDGKIVACGGQEIPGIPGQGMFENVIRLQSTPLEDEIEIYPNPCEDVLFFQANNALEKLELYTVQGDLILSKQITLFAGELDLTSFAQGAYIIKFYFHNQFISKIIIVS